jgi:hypothetical protein
MLFGLAAAGCEGLGRSESVDDKAGSAAGSAESAKPCDDFAARICGKTANEFSTTCMSVKSTVELLTPETCKLALENADHSLKALGQRNMSCDELQAKLCADMRSVPRSCERVKQYTRRFPHEKCKEMLGRYSDVLVDLKQALKVP